MVTDGRGDPVTEARWQFIEMGINAFWSKYPRAYSAWITDVNSTKTLFNLAKEGELKKAGFRNTMAFPTIERNDEVIDGLKPFLDKHLPGLTAPDKPGKPNKLFYEFAKRFPMFVVSEKL